ncbi:Nonribosomal peptide synthetase 13 [Madurella mycetomatis]|uniref:Nonribosomal peptide synthetase 13 n=1 Tax=Madurella mycetomatis TaxID=100816 RepID=A0A175WFW7_9PEZI|nr:Nonribosomal peptide synthetase 13 [Madurella mycetomatis]
MSRADIDDATLYELAKTCNVPANQIEDVYACVHQQLDQMSDARYERFQIVLSFGPEIDLGRWCEVLGRVVAMNPVLRTRIVHCPNLGSLQVVINEDHTTERFSGMDLDQYLHDDQTRRLGYGDALLRTAFVDRNFVVSMHHAIMDYWSTTTLLREDLILGYISHPDPPQRRPPFKDFVKHCMSIDEATATSFWASRLGKRIPTIFPPLKRAGYTPYPDQMVTQELSLKGRVGIDKIPATHVPSFVEAAWALTAASYADSDSIAYGFVLSGRSSTAGGGLDTTFLGPAHAEVPVQVNLGQRSTMTVEQFVRDRATSIRQLQAHPAIQYGLQNIAKVSEPARVASGFQTLLNIIPILPSALPTAKNEKESSIIRMDRMVWRAKGYVALMVRCKILDFSDHGILVEARYDPAVIEEVQLRRVLNQFEHTLHTLLDAPPQTKLDKLSLLNSHDQAEVLAWNRALAAEEKRTLHQLFIARARASPESTAVRVADGSLISYRELDQTSDRLAHELRRRGVVPGNLVPFIMEKSLSAIVALLATLKAGGVCMPLNPDDLALIRRAITSSLTMAKTTPDLLLASPTTHTTTAGLVPQVFTVSTESIARLPEADIHSPLPDGREFSHELAYIITTSGTSTGSPKCVGLDHRSLVSTLDSIAEGLGWPDSGMRMLHFAGYESGTSIYEIFGTFLSGGCLCIPPPPPSTGDLTQNVCEFINSMEVNWALLTPTVLRRISPSDVPTLRSVLSTGETIDPRTFKSWVEAPEAKTRFFSSYGTTETSAFNTVTELTPGSDSSSIGTSLAASRIWIVNPQTPQLELAPIGSVGEIIVQSIGSPARRYLEDSPKKTGSASASFLSQPPTWAPPADQETRWFRTRDLAKYNPDGSISLIGRQENRIKIASTGRIVQLDEVERVLLGCEAIRDVVVQTKIVAGRTQLVAVVSMALAGSHQHPGHEDGVDNEAGLEDVKAYANSKLPTDMVPTVWYAVGRPLVRTALGKVDKAAVRELVKTLRR